MSDRALNVFVNCPFDADYRPFFEAIVFTITASGYRVRCALEESDSGDVRYDKLCRLIHESDRSVHDLSRVELNPEGYPRFNMPFEFGLYQGARRFGTKPHKRKSALAMVREPYKLPVYLSDVAGSDPEAHNGDHKEVIRIVRKYLHFRPDGSSLPGAAHIGAALERFRIQLPELAEALKMTPNELDPIRDYRDYINLLAEFLRLA